MTTHQTLFAAPTVASVLDAIPAAAVVLDDAGRIRLVNQRWLQFCIDEGGRPETVLPPIDYLAVCDAEVVDGIRAVLDGAVDRFEVEYPCHSVTTERWFRMVVTPLEAGALVIHLDITGEYARVSRWLATTSSPIIELDPSGNAVFVNQAWAALQRVPRRVLLGAGWAAHLASDDARRLDAAVQATVRDRNDRTVDIALPTDDGEASWLRFLISAYADDYRRLRRISLVGMDVTAARRLNDQLAAGAERERIAADIHDLVIQDLVAAGLALEAARKSTAPDPELLGEITAILEHSIGDLRALAAQLPSQRLHLSDLEAVTRQAALALGFSPKVHVAVDLSRLDDRIAIHLLPVVKEALSNIARHAHATGASVDLSEHEGDLVLVIRDDGIGMPDSPTRSSGTANISHRAGVLDGSARWSGAPGGGTVLEWRVPLARPDQIVKESVR